MPTCAPPKTTVCPRPASRAPSSRAAAANSSPAPTFDPVKTQIRVMAALLQRYHATGRADGAERRRQRERERPAYARRPMFHWDRPRTVVTTRPCRRGASRREGRRTRRGLRRPDMESKRPRRGTGNPDASVGYGGASCPGFRGLARAAVCAVMTAAVMTAAEPAAGQTRTVWDGVYTEAQAERGREHYRAICGYCHRDDLSGGGSEAGAPALRGPFFLNQWRGRPLVDLFVTIGTTMAAAGPRLPARPGGDRRRQLPAAAERHAGRRDRAAAPARPAARHRNDPAARPVVAGSIGSQNGMPPGETELPPRLDPLRGIVLSRPPDPAGSIGSPRRPAEPLRAPSGRSPVRSLVRTVRRRGPHPRAVRGYGELEVALGPYGSLNRWRARAPPPAPGRNAAATRSARSWRADHQRHETCSNHPEDSDAPHLESTRFSRFLKDTPCHVPSPGNHETGCVWTQLATSCRSLSLTEDTSAGRRRRFEATREVGRCASG